LIARHISKRELIMWSCVSPCNQWRAVIKVDDKDLPSEKVRRMMALKWDKYVCYCQTHYATWGQAIWENCHGLARYAAIAQENGLVPIVEPEVTLGEGDYSIERTAYISERVNSQVSR